jgi:hypothetical protein
MTNADDPPPQFSWHIWDDESVNIFPYIPTE